MNLSDGFNPMAQGRQEDYIIRAVKQFIEEKLAELANALREEFSSNTQQVAISNGSWDDFHKQSQYLDMLIRVSGTDHKVHEEIDEAIKKLKEITYN